MKSKTFPTLSKTAYFFILLLLPTSMAMAQSQHYNHFTFWSRVAVNKKINENWSLAGEFHVRQQSDYHLSRLNPLAKPLLRAGRLLLNYKTKNWTFIFNPNFFYNYPLLGKEADFANPAGGEWRMAAYTEYTQPLKKWSLRIRPGYEYRLLALNNWQATGRGRLRLMGRYSVTEKVTLSFGDELLLNVGPNPANNRFNQNQLTTGIIIRPTEHFGVEMGFNYLLRKRRTGTEFDDENALNLVFSIYL